MAPKRILTFSLAYFPRLVGGAEIAVKEITNRIALEAYEFEMITLRIDAADSSSERIGNILLHRVGLPSLSMTLNKSLFPFLAFIKASMLQWARPFDLCWSIMANYSGFAALFFKFTNPQIPFFLTLQEGDPLSHIKRRVRLIYPLFLLIFKKADYIQTISNYLADFARSLGARCPISVVPNGVDLKKFQFVIISSQTLKLQRKIRLEEKDWIVITVSRLVEKNAVGDIVAALNYLPENVRLLIVGTGPLERTLRSQVESFHLQSRVKFLGFVRHEELPQYLKIADVFVRPSRSEGLGNAFLEAMAAGLPVVATKVGGIPEFLRDGETGLFAEVANPRSIAEKIKKLLENEALRESLRKRGRLLVEERYDWNLIAVRIKSEILDAILRH